MWQQSHLAVVVWYIHARISRRRQQKVNNKLYNYILYKLGQRQSQTPISSAFQLVDKEYFRSKKFGSEIFWIQKNVGNELGPNVLDQKNFVLKNFVSKKIPTQPV